LKHERATEEIRELAALYALGSLTQHEAKSFEAHIQEGCSVCEAEFRRFEQIIAKMADEIAAPDYVRDLLLARIERESQSAAVIKEVQAKPIPPKAAAPATHQPLMLSQQYQKKTNPFAWTLIIIILIVAVVMGVTWWKGRSRISELENTISLKNEDIKDKEDVLEIQRGTIAQLDQIYAAAGKSGSRVFQLSGQPAAPAASGIILWDGAEGKFIAFGALPAAPQGKVYQFWFLSSTLRIPAGSIKQEVNGQFYISGMIPREAVGATVAAISLEPDNGSQLPTAFYAVARIN
jgi:anti-sigma-K factor RskA